MHPSLSRERLAATVCRQSCSSAGIPEQMRRMARSSKRAYWGEHSSEPRRCGEAAGELESAPVRAGLPGETGSADMACCDWMRRCRRCSTHSLSQTRHCATCCKTRCITIETTNHSLRGRLTRLLRRPRALAVLGPAGRWEASLRPPRDDGGRHSHHEAARL